MRLGPLSKSAGWLFGLVLIAACGQRGQPELRGARYLDPGDARLELSASEILDRAGRVVLSVSALAAAGSIEPWELVGPAPKIGASGGALITTNRQAPSFFELSFEPGEAPVFDTLELDTDLRGECTARVQLFFADGTSRTIQQWLPYRPERARLELFLGPLPTHTQLTGLRLTPSLDQTRTFELFRLDLAWRGLAEPVGFPLAGDEGLVELGGLGRRVWALTSGGRLEVELELPAGARFWTRAWAPAPGDADFDPTVTIRVPGKSNTIDMQVIAVPRVPFANDERTSFTFEADLSAFAGRDVQISFEAGRGAPGSSPALAALFESPRLLPAAAAPERRPDVVLVTLDTTRADFALDNRIAPELAALGKQGLVFTNAWSPSNSTTPAHGSLLTGLMPHEHGAIAVGKFGLPSRVTTLAERLRMSGYLTAAFTSVEHIDTAHGFGQGFDVFLDGQREGSRDGRRALHAATQFLVENRTSGAPLFLWLHLFDPHTPYSLPPDVETAAGPMPPAGELPTAALPTELPDWARKQVQLHWLPAEDDAAGLRRHYAEGVHFVDSLLGELLAELRGTGRFDQALIAVTADHGEGLGERGIFASHVSLLPPVLRVPLVLKLPRDFSGKLPAGGARIETAVSTVDLMPTMLEVLGLEAGGRSLLRPDPERALWFESDRLSQVGRLGDAQLAILTLRETNLHAGPAGAAMAQPGLHEAFDLRSQEGLATELVRAGAPPAELDAWLDEASRRVLEGSSRINLERTLAPAELERLRALGYLGQNEKR